MTVPNRRSYQEPTTAQVAKSNRLLEALIALLLIVLVSWLLTSCAAHKEKRIFPVDEYSKAVLENNNKMRGTKLLCGHTVDEHYFSGRDVRAACEAKREAMR